MPPTPLELYIARNSKKLGLTDLINLKEEAEVCFLHTLLLFTLCFIMKACVRHKGSVCLGHHPIVILQWELLEGKESFIYLGQVKKTEDIVLLRNSLSKKQFSRTFTARFGIVSRTYRSGRRRALPAQATHTVFTTLTQSIGFCQLSLVDW